MKNKYIFIISILSVFLTGILQAQDCTDYHQYHCPYGDYTFFYSRQSKSALFRQGQTSELRITVYGGEDYYIAVCAHRKFGDIRFRIMEDNEEKTLIFDNADDEMAESIIFSNDITRNLILEVSVPESKTSSIEKRCVGVVIQFRKTDQADNYPGKTGF
jgi:hypothetical protein